MKKSEKKLYHKPDLDSAVQRALTEAEAALIINGQNYAALNKPPLNSTTHEYFLEDHLRYQAIIDTVGKQLQAQTLQHEVVEHDKATKGQVQALQGKLGTAKDTAIHLNRELNGAKVPYSHARLLLAWGALVGIGLFEGALSTPVYQSFGYGLLESVAMGILFAGALTVFAHTFEHIAAKGRTVWQRRSIAIILLTFLTGLFVYMSQARADYLSQQTANDAGDTVNMHFSAWPFILTSLLLFIVAVAINHFYYPSKEQRNALRINSDLVKRKNDNTAEISRLEQEIITASKANAELRNINASIIIYGSMVERIIISHAQKGFALWKKNNESYRLDKGRPNSFSGIQYPFPFNTNFDFINPTQK